MNLVICGFGRAGKSLVEMIINSKVNQLEMVICRRNSINMNKDVGQILFGYKNGINIIPIDKAKTILKGKRIDVVIDFSHHDMTQELLNLCGEIRSNLVICTTNHSAEEISRLEHMADKHKIGVVYCPNLTVGINLLMDFVKRVSMIFPNYEFDILEKHPKGKKKPTATAKMLAKAARDDEISIHSVRMDGYIGVHQITITDGIERITLVHESLSRQAFAKGAILAAEYIQGKTGFFRMEDVIHHLESFDKSNTL